MRVAFLFAGQFRPIDRYLIDQSLSILVKDIDKFNRAWNNNMLIGNYFGNDISYVGIDWKDPNLAKNSMRLMGTKVMEIVNKNT